jgi:hypothetical protein
MNKSSFAVLSRRLVSTILATAFVGATAAYAAAPVDQAQVPGFYRHQVGQATVTAVYDGYVSLDP